MRAWASTTLGVLCSEGGTVQTGPFGSQLHANDYVDQGVPVVMPVNIGDNRIIEQGIMRIREGDAERLVRHRLRAGDIVYSRRGDITRRALIRHETGWLCGTGCLLVRPGRNVDSIWLSSWLGTPLVHEWLNQHSVGATMPNLNTGILSALPVNVPPLAEQRRIARVLGALDDLIDTNESTARSMEQLLAAQFGRLGFDREGELPLSELVVLNPAYSKPRGQAPYVDMRALPTDGYSINVVGSRSAVGGARFVNGDTLVARITPCLENGKTAFVDCLEPGEVGVGSTEFIVMKPRDSVADCWPYFLARSDRFREYAIRHMSGTSGRQRLAAEALASYPIAQPSEASLAEFSTLSTPLLAAMRSLLDEARVLRRTRDELLPLLMSGRVRVRDLESA